MCYQGGAWVGVRADTVAAFRGPRGIACLRYVHYPTMQDKYDNVPTLIGVV